MKFIDALYKYDEITRDNKEIYYYMNNIIYMRTEGLDEANSTIVADYENVNLLLKEMSRNKAEILYI